MIVWSVNSTKALTSPILQLLNNANFVLRDDNRVESEDYYIWQSFDHITDTLLPGMKLGWDLQRGLLRNITSWSSDNDPSDGEFTFSLDSPEMPQLVLTKGTEKQNRWGPWDGVRFSGNNELKPNPIFSPSFNATTEEVFYTFNAGDDNFLLRSVVTQRGLIKYFLWNEDMKFWTSIVTLQGGGCDSYGV